VWILSVNTKPEPQEAALFFLACVVAAIFATTGVRSGAGIGAESFLYPEPENYSIAASK
jgi:hypothetical protein